jgi:hypothetical protein
MTRLGGQARWRRRAVVLIALSIVLGFLTTWAVAWVCAVWLLSDFMPIDMRVEIDDSSSAAMVWVRPTAWWGRETVRVSVREGRKGIPSAWLQSVDSAPKWTRAYEHWQQGQLGPKQGHLADSLNSAHIWLKASWIEGRSGWPAKCLCWWSPSHSAPPEDSITVPSWLFAMTKNQHSPALPYRPYWLALIIDTFFYTALWTILFVAPCATRRTFRRLRRRCPSCGYNIRHCESPGCPECGWGREEVAAVAKGDGA